MMWLKVLAPAVCYFLFNWQFFRCVESILNVKPLSRCKVIGTFLINFSVFFLCSVLNIHLIVNWVVFLSLLLTEQVILYKQQPRKCILSALLGTQFGLAANILFRSLLAIILDKPLVFFDNSVEKYGNMKVYPVLLGFLVTGVVFLLVARFALLKKLALIMEHKGMLVFLTGLLTAMYFYLCMNLFVYYIEQNSLILKLWSMKSAIFVIVGEYLAIIISIRMGEIAVYRAKSQESRELLAKEKLREQELRIIAATDPLTGCENRRQANKRIQEALDAGCNFCLCFIDLNKLKTVNDNYGHEMGDKYLLNVVRVLEDIQRDGDFLFRQGGDEFLLLFSHHTASEAQNLLRQAQDQLEETSRSQNYPFHMSFSYGMATPEDGDKVSDLIHISDTRMYQMKTAARI